MTNYEKHLVFMRAWSDGAACRSYVGLQLLSEEQGIYDAGYKTGMHARKNASESNANLLGLDLAEIRLLKGTRCL